MDIPTPGDNEPWENICRMWPNYFHRVLQVPSEANQAELDQAFRNAVKTILQGDSSFKEKEELGLVVMRAFIGLTHPTLLIEYKKRSGGILACFLAEDWITEWKRNVEKAHRDEINEVQARANALFREVQNECFGEEIIVDEESSADNSADDNAGDSADSSKEVLEGVIEQVLHPHNKHRYYTIIGLALRDEPPEVSEVEEAFKRRGRLLTEHVKAQAAEDRAWQAWGRVLMGTAMLKNPGIKKIYDELLQKVPLVGEPGAEFDEKVEAMEDHCMKIMQCQGFDGEFGWFVAKEAGIRKGFYTEFISPSKLVSPVKEKLPRGSRSPKTASASKRRSRRDDSSSGSEYNFPKRLDIDELEARAAKRKFPPKPPIVADEKQRRDNREFFEKWQKADQARFKARPIIERVQRLDISSPARAGPSRGEAANRPAASNERPTTSRALPVIRRSPPREKKPKRRSYWAMDKGPLPPRSQRNRRLLVIRARARRARAEVKKPPNKECPYCHHRGHYAEKCPEPGCGTSTEREAICARNGYCRVCIRAGHWLRDCPRRNRDEYRGCQVCEEEHHRSLCPYTYGDLYQPL